MKQSKKNQRESRHHRQAIEKFRFKKWKTKKGNNILSGKKDDKKQFWKYKNK